jgi:hypothetical protein
MCDIVLNDVIFSFDSSWNITNDITDLKEWTVIPKIESFNGNGHTISGVYGAGLFQSCTFLSNLNVKNSYIVGGDKVGGICSDSKGIDDCTFSGVVKGEDRVAGIVASCTGSVNNCINYGTILSQGSCAGIIAEYLSLSDTYNCVNYGDIIGVDNVGGIVAFISFGGSSLIDYNNLINYGNIYGNTNVGGVVGNFYFNGGWLKNAKNYGVISAKDNTGGIVGYASGIGAIQNSLNYNIVNGETRVGGIVGSVSCINSIFDCANAAEVNGISDVGGIVGYVDIFIYNTQFTDCYYLKNENINSTLQGVGNMNDSAGECEPKDENFFTT